MPLQNLEVQTVTASVLGSTFGWSVRPSHTAQPEKDAIRIGSSVQITGHWDGEVSVFLSPELARRAAANIYGSDTFAVVDRQLHEAVRQIAGQIGADIHDQLPSPCELHIPSPAMISGGAIRKANVSTVLDCDGEPCWVVVDGPEVEEITQPLGPSRRFSRTEVPLGVTVSAGGTVHRSTGPNNLSMSGVFVRGESSIPRGRDCVVNVHVGQGEQESVQVSGRVARVTPEGFAVEFLEVDLESYRQLRDLVYFNSSHPQCDSLAGLAMSVHGHE